MFSTFYFLNSWTDLIKKFMLNPSFMRCIRCFHAFLSNEHGCDYNSWIQMHFFSWFIISSIPDSIRSKKKNSTYLWKCIWAMLMCRNLMDHTEKTKGELQPTSPSWTIEVSDVRFIMSSKKLVSAISVFRHSFLLAV